MTAATMPFARSHRETLSTLIRAGFATGVSDVCFATVLNYFMLQRSFPRVWQGVASVLVGKSALTGGVPMVILGLVMHFAIALGWSAVFLVAVRNSWRLRAVIDSEYGALKVAAVYGPLIWVMMALVFIPQFVHRFPPINASFCVLFVGHFPFVGLPITSIIGNGSK